MSNKAFSYLKYTVLAYLLLTVIYPLLELFLSIKEKHILDVINAAQFWPMVENSLITTLVATMISVALAFVLALLLARSLVRFKSVWVVLFTIPMLIPSISHGMGLILLLGDNGIITNFLGLNVGIYGYLGIILGSVLYSFPVAFLLFYDSFQYEDYTLYEAARVLGLSRWQMFIKITLPYMKRAFISAILAVFTMIFTDYGVPLITGGTVMTLPVYMYREVIGMMNFSGGAVVSLILIMPAVVAFLLDLRKSSAGNSNNLVTKCYCLVVNKTRNRIAYAVFTLVLIFLCLPIFAFVCLSFVEQYPLNMQLSLENIRRLLTGGVGRYFVNSLVVAILTAALGTAMAYFAAYATSKSQQSLDKVLHFMSMFSLAIPGVVLGLAFALSFNELPIYPTLLILIIVNIAHFFSSPYLLAYNCLGKFNGSLEDAAAALGISKLRMLCDVYLPSTINTIVEMYSYFFVNAMITISAVSFLVNFRTMTLSLMIPQFESQSFIEATAIVSLLILVVNLVEKSIVFWIKIYKILKRNNISLFKFLDLSKR